MKTFIVVCSLFLMTGLAACGGSTSSSDDDTDDDATFTATDAQNVGAGLNNSQSAVYTDIFTQYGDQLAAAFGAMTLDVTKGTRSGTINVNNVYNCQVSGHITSTGSFPWSYTYPDSPNTTPEASFSISGQLMQQVSDPTNNLNDCEQSGGLILDGTIYSQLTASGQGSSAQATFSTDGTIEFNRRGPTGGLIPMGSCSIFLTVHANASGGTATGSASGTICGQSYSYSY
ncbi:MAG: hypothetical protein WC956_02750 [bacterium]